MENNGPSWWNTRELRDSEGKGHYYTLFEFFRKNAREYEILRVSLSDGFSSHEGTFSYDEIFGSRAFRIGSDDASRGMRQIIDDDNDYTDDPTRKERVYVQSDDEPSIIISLDEGEDIKLQLTGVIEERAFVGRIMPYAMHMESKLQIHQETLQTKLAELNQDIAEVEKLAKAKHDEDAKLQTAVSLIMDEKRKYSKPS